MSQFRGLQGRQAKTIETTEANYSGAVPIPPPITGPLFNVLQEQTIYTPDQLDFTSPLEANTDQLSDIPQFSPILKMGYETGSVTHDLREPLTTRDLRGAHATRVLSNPGTTQALTNVSPGMPVPSTRASLVIPGKRKKVTEEVERPGKRMHPYLRYGLVVGSMLGIIGVALMTLTPLSSDQNRFTGLSNVVHWIQTQQTAWNVGSHMSDQQQATTNSTTANAPTAPGSPPITILPTNQYVMIARQAAITAGISPVYFVNQINAESSFNPDAISPVGAVGIAQFLPSTAAGLGIDPYDPIQALYGAARHMAALTRSYGGNYAKALAAYNAGPGNVDYAVRQGGANWMNFVPYETRQYIYKIMGI